MFRLIKTACLAAALCFCLIAAPLPQIVKQGRKFTLLVDGKPFIMLGGQVNNSSGWPARMKEIWPVFKALNANTAEIPVYWEAVEPKPGEFHFEAVDQIIRDARVQNMRLDSAVVRDVEERRDGLCARLGEGGHREVSADDRLRRQARPRPVSAQRSDEERRPRRFRCLHAAPEGNRRRCSYGDHGPGGERTGLALHRPRPLPGLQQTVRGRRRQPRWPQL